jgi:ATP-dependent helicase YprA (DUF1998 family)
LYLGLNNGENELTLASVVKEIATRWRSSSPKINKRASERASRKDNMDNYFAEDNAVKFDHQNGNIETICFCVSKQRAKRIAAALNLLDNQEG